MTTPKRFGGSKLLAAELKRLRGSRTRAELAALSTSPRFGDRIRPLTVDALSRFEMGVSSPTVEEIHALATLFRVETETLVELVVGEKLATQEASPATLDEARAAHEAALRRGDWHAAMAQAIAAEELAETPAQRMDWKANRALTMSRLGLRRGALNILHETSASRDTAPERRFMHYRHLGDCLATSGYYEMADSAIAKAVEHAPEDLSDKWKWELTTSKIRIVLMSGRHSEGADADAVEESLRSLDEARALIAVDDDAVLFLDLYQAVARSLLGQPEAAEAELEELIERARASGHTYLEMVALADLRTILRGVGRLDEAATALYQAEKMAQAGDHVDALFEVSFELLLVAVARADSKAESRFMDQCRTYYPLVQARTPSVLEYESIMRGGGP